MTPKLPVPSTQHDHLATGHGQLWRQPSDHTRPELGLLKDAGSRPLLDSWRLPGLLSALGTGSGQVGVQVRERVLTYLSSGVRMIETPDPANCASCPENYYSVCPVQRTKGPCDGSRQQCPAQGGPGPAPIRPSLGHLLHSHPHHLSRALPPTLLEQAGRVASPNPPSQAYWL